MQDTAEDPAARAAVGVAILTWRGEAMTRACLETLQRSTSWPMPVLVVDNASGTGEGERLAAAFGPPVEARTTDVNGGVPGGYNVGIEWAASRGLAHVLLLNNDTLLDDPSMLESLLAAAGPDVAAVGPVIRRPDGWIQSAGGRLDLPGGRVRHRHAPKRADIPYPCDWLDGSVLLVSVEAARAIGGFEPEYFLYWEEVDWCVRARRAGFQCLVQPAAAITHLGSATVTGPQKYAYWQRNKLLFLRRHVRSRYGIRTLGSFVGRTVPQLLVNEGPSVRRWAWVLRGAVGALAWNTRDALRRRGWQRQPDGPPIG